jgi:DNA-binding protein
LDTFQNLEARERNLEDSRINQSPPRASIEASAATNVPNVDEIEVVKPRLTKKVRINEDKVRTHETKVRVHDTEKPQSIRCVNGIKFCQCHLETVACIGSPGHKKF